MRAVLDANVLIAALLAPRGAPAQLVSRWLAGEFELVVSEALLSELSRALAYPKLRDRIPAADGDDYIAMLRRFGRVGVDPEDPPPRSSDSSDDYLLALAESERAALVSGDVDLLALAADYPVRSPRAFLAELEAASR